MKKLGYTCLSFFLLFGLFVSSIGVTWCSYQVIQEFPTTYFVKSNGKFILNYENEEWNFDSTTQTYSNEFTVSNQNEQTNSLYLTFITTQKATYSMVVIEPSGREVKYDSILVHDEELNYHYEFIDKEGDQVKLEIEGNEQIKQQIRLEAKQITDSFISEIILEDAAFEIQTNAQTLTSNYIPLELNSNYLSLNENVNVLLEENTIELTFSSNMTVQSKLITNDKQVTFNVTENEVTTKYKEFDLTINENETKSILLDVTNHTNDVITVEWQIIEEEKVVQTLKANFMMKPQTETYNGLLPIIEMTEIDGDFEFNQYKPIQFMIQSDIDVNVQIGNVYPANTYYSYDNGFTWFVTTKEGVLDVPLTFGTPTQVTIDLSKTDIEWQEIGFEVAAYIGEFVSSILDFEMIPSELEELEVMHSSMGIINNNDCSFTINTDDVMITLEKFSEGEYVPITEEYFTLESADNLTYTIKQNNVDVPKGLYKVKIQQFYNGILIKEEELSFFTIKEVNA